MADLHTLTLTQLSDKLTAGECTSVDIVNDLLSAIDANDGKVGAYLTIDRDSALKQAAAADKARAVGATSPMLGIPVAIKDLLNVKGQPCTCSSKILDGYTAPYDATVISKLREAGAILLGDRIAIGQGVLVESGAMIKSPAIIGDMTEIRQGAYLRGYCLTGKRCVLGHTTEIKHSIFLNDAKAGHFAYIGDSILGNDANLGAGTKFANLKFLPGNVSILHKGEHIDTGRRKFGAILGDKTQTGCNSVTSPGTLLSKQSILMPNTTAKGGYYEKKSVIRIH